MSPPVFDEKKFRSRYPEFDSVPLNKIILIWYYDVVSYIPIGFDYSEDPRNIYMPAKVWAWSMVTAHLLKLEWLGLTDGYKHVLDGDIVTSSKAGDALVSYTNTDYKAGDSDYESFFKKTIYGKQFLAYLNRPANVYNGGMVSVRRRGGVL